MKKEDLINYSYAKLIAELIKLSNIHNYRCKIIYQEKFEKIKMNYPVYRFVINPSAKIKFCIMAGFHGDEIAGPLTMLKLFSNPKKYFNKDICYYIYPVINPTGFDLRTRGDDDKVDLNTWNKISVKNKKFGEVQALYKDIKKIRFDAVISMHEDTDFKDFYIYNFEEEKNPVYREIMKSTSKIIKISDKKRIYGDKTNGKGEIINLHDQSVEDRLFLMKRAKIALCTETPGKLDIHTRIKVNLNNIQKINNYLLKNN